MARKLTDLRPCDNCKGPVGALFHVLRFSIAVVNVETVNRFLGMHQFFQGRAVDALVENFTPGSEKAITIAMDEPEFKDDCTELFICHNCFLNKPLDLPILQERRSEEIHRAEQKRIQP